MSDAPRPDYRGRRALVLGVTGFLGGWTAAALVRAGADVHVSARDPRAALAMLRWHGVDARIVATDLGPPGAAARLLDEVRADAVFNLAGYGVRTGQRDEALAERMNVGLPEEIARTMASQTTGSGVAPVLVHTGSGAEYGSAGGDLREDGPVLPTSTYGRTKLAGTRAIERVAASSLLRARVARPFTVYGPGEPEGRLLPALLAAAKSGGGADLTAGLQRRDFVYVADVAEALLRLGLAGVPRSAVVNVATGMLVAVRDFVLEAAAVLGIDRPSLRFGAVANMREEMEHEPVNTDRLAAIVGWRPRTTPAEGLLATREFLARAERSPR